VGRVTKIMLCGRGGSGKSTVTAMMARYLAGNGQNVLVMDADTSSRSLSDLVGLKRPKRSFADELGGPDALTRKLGAYLAPSASPESRRIHVDELPAACTSRRDCLALLEVGKAWSGGNEAGEILEELGRNVLSRLDDRNWWVLVDNEAGMDRYGTSHRATDAFLFVSDGSAESLESAAFATRLFLEVEKPLLVLLNRVAPDENEEAERLARRLGVTIDAVLLPDDAVREASLGGRPVPLKGEAVAVIGRILSRLESALNPTGRAQIRRRL
jgi:CO dehydrogenase maturation factor